LTFFTKLKNNKMYEMFQNEKGINRLFFKQKDFRNKTKCASKKKMLLMLRIRTKTLETMLVGGIKRC
jgi:hypothetical protein